MTIKMTYVEEMRIKRKLNRGNLSDLFKLIITDSEFDEFFTREFQQDAKALDAFLTENVSIDVYYEYCADIRANVTLHSSEKLDDDEIAEKISGGWSNFSNDPEIEYADCIARFSLEFRNDSVALISSRELDIAA